MPQHQQQQQQQQQRRRRLDSIKYVAIKTKIWAEKYVKKGLININEGYIIEIFEENARFDRNVYYLRVKNTTTNKVGLVGARHVEKHNDDIPNSDNDNDEDSDSSPTSQG